MKESECIMTRGFQTLVAAEASGRLVKQILGPTWGASRGSTRGIFLKCKPRHSSFSPCTGLPCKLRIKSKAYKFQIETYEPFHDLLPLISQLTISCTNLKNLDFSWNLKKKGYRISLSLLLLLRIHLSPSFSWLSILLSFRS